MDRFLQQHRLLLPPVGRLVAGLLAVAAAGFAIAAPAQAFTRTDQLLAMGDGVSLASSFYAPDGAPPAGGWPAVLVLHGIGGSRGTVSEIAEQYLAPQGYAVLTVDATPTTRCSTATCPGSWSLRASARSGTTSRRSARRSS